MVFKRIYPKAKLGYGVRLEQIRTKTAVCCYCGKSIIKGMVEIKFVELKKHKYLNKVFNHQKGESYLHVDCWPIFRKNMDIFLNNYENGIKKAKCYNFAKHI